MPMERQTPLDAAIEAARDDIRLLCAKLTAYDAPSGVRYLGDQVAQQAAQLARLLETRDRIAHLDWPSGDAPVRRRA
jgi:hypothetical protein